jgi:hypothetical protein
MPRTSARVVCTLCVTIETLAPTSWLTSVDLPAFGAPISATKPERVGAVRCICFSHLQHIFSSRRQQDVLGRSLFGDPLGAAVALSGFPIADLDGDVNTGSWSGPSAREPVDRRHAKAGMRPFLQFGLGVAAGAVAAKARDRPVTADERARRLEPAIEINRGNQRFDHVGAHF